MPCKHRFYDKLIEQKSNIEFLFIGTFNPQWDAVNGNNAEYFYGRATNQFWCICPHAFDKSCLIDKSPAEWETFCTENNIALTDLVKEIINADSSQPEHKNLLTAGFSDANLDMKNNGKYVFSIDDNTAFIKQLIASNQDTLKGVFFTRSTMNSIPRIWSYWISIKEQCDKLNIPNAALPSPSPKANGDIRSKIATWRQQVQRSKNRY